MVPLALSKIDVTEVENVNQTNQDQENICHRRWNMEIINGIYISDGTMENADDIDRHIIEALRNPEINRQTAAKLLKGYIDSRSGRKWMILLPV